MNLPPWWRRAAFGVAESAEILLVPEDTLRTWIAREPSGEWMGTKLGGRVFLRGVDLYFYALIREFVAYGVQVRVAMHTAAAIAEFCVDRLPPEKFIIIRRRVGVSEFEQTNDPDIEQRPAAIIPIHTLARVLIERCSETSPRETAG